MNNRGHASHSAQVASEQERFISEKTSTTEVMQANMVGPSPIKKPPKIAPKKDLGGDSVKDQLSEDLRQAIWPLYDDELFIKILNQNPDIMTFKSGPSQETLLHRACRYGNKKATHILLDKGATPSVRNSKGITPLHMACQFNHFDIVKMLIDKDAPLDEKDEHGDQPIHSAGKAGSKEIIKLFVDKGIKVCSPGRHKNTIIHYAAKCGRLELLQGAVAMGAPINLENSLKETPLHLAASFYTRANNGNVDVIECLLNAGAKIDARTEWGDLPIHYAACWGTHQVLEYLFEEGSPVDKPAADTTFYEEFFEQQGVPEDRARFYLCSLLQKGARSGCIYKNELIMKRIMKARNILGYNMYHSTRGTGDEEIQEMNQQQLQLLELAKEFYDSKPLYGETTFEMYMKNCPDALTHLFDLCLIKPMLEQMQGVVYFDFFLFTPSENTSCKSELKAFDSLINYGKERFLTHPLLEVFLKLKWYRSMKFYLFYVLLYVLFAFSLGGFLLTHLGHVYHGAPEYEYQEHSGWWFFLAVTHVLVSLISLGKGFTTIANFIRITLIRKGDKMPGAGVLGFIKKLIALGYGVAKDIAPPVLTGLVLYAPFDIKIIRYLGAVDIILTCQTFMGIISRLPGVGLYVHMLGKVFSTVLNFVAVYIWVLLGYAIAFHIILPASGPFGMFGDAFVKVLTMLMGEYEYVANFVNDPSPSWVNKAIFVMFLIEMTVVLMNLVLGLAVADIDELQKNSAVQRMIQETYTVIFIDKIVSIFQKIPGVNMFTNKRIGGESCLNFLDIYSIDIVDLEPNPANRLKAEIYLKEEPKTYTCPHNIISSICQIMLERKIGWAESTDEKFCVKSTLKSIMEDLGKIKAALNLVDEEKEEKENEFDEAIRKSMNS